MVVARSFHCYKDFSSTSENKSGLAGTAAIGGAVGGVVIFIIIVLLELSIILYIKHSRNKKNNASLGN